MTSEHFASSSRVVNLISMAFALFRTESDQRINVPIRTNTQRFCLVLTVRYQAKGFSSPRNPTRAIRYAIISWSVSPWPPDAEHGRTAALSRLLFQDFPKTSDPVNLA